MRDCLQHSILYIFSDPIFLLNLLLLNIFDNNDDFIIAY